MMEILEPNTCYRGCCSSEAIRLSFPRASYSLFSTIARGSESTVFEATLHGRKVAAKKPVLSTSDDLDRFHRELQLLCELDHPSLAKLVGAHSRPPDYMLFFEFYEMGSLAHKLHAAEWSPSVEEAIVIACDLSCALQYMHELGIVHRDIKPGNILLDSEFRPHLSDFGLASYMKDLKQVSERNWKSSGKPTGGFHKKDMVGTLIYMAPEILRKDIHTEKSDVYSFSILINELLTGVVPYTNLRTEAQAHTVLEMIYTEQKLTTAVVSEGLRPALAQTRFGLLDRLIALIQRCWDSNPAFRPSFNEIAKELDVIRKDVIKMEVGQVSDKLSSSQNSQYLNGFKVLPSFREHLNWAIQGELSSKKAFDGIRKAKPWLSSLPKSLQYLPALSWGSFATCGRREIMEDAHFLTPNIWHEKDVHLFGIFDGHRGAAAAEFSARAMPGFLLRSAYTSSPSEALREAFVNTDIAFREELTSHFNTRRINKNCHPGCTALAGLIVRDKLLVANAGDCRAILCRAGRPFPMSKEHLACCPEERMRVINKGMEVTWQVDTWRVGPVALQVTRSIGDDDLKPAIIAEPEIIKTTLSPDDEFLVMASDGLWDAMSNEEAISFIRDTVKEPAICSKRLAMEAVERGGKDNITVIVIFLVPVSTAERIH